MPADAELAGQPSSRRRSRWYPSAFFVGTSRYQPPQAFPTPSCGLLIRVGPATWSWRPSRPDRRRASNRPGRCQLRGRRGECGGPGERCSDARRGSVARSGEADGGEAGRCAVDGERWRVEGEAHCGGCGHVKQALGWRDAHVGLEADGGPGLAAVASAQARVAEEIAARSEQKNSSFTRLRFQKLMLIARRPLMSSTTSVGPSCWQFARTISWANSFAPPGSHRRRMPRSPSWMVTDFRPASDATRRRRRYSHWSGRHHWPRGLGEAIGALPAEDLRAAGDVLRAASAERPRALVPLFAEHRGGAMGDDAPAVLGAARDLGWGWS